MAALQQLERRMRAFSARRRGVRNATLGYRALGIALIVGIAALLLLSGHLPGVWVNVALFVVAGLVLAVLPVVYLVRRERYRNAMNEAFEIEKLVGGLNSRLISALDFAQDAEPTPLRSIVIDHAVADVRTPFEKQLDRSRRNRLRIRAAVLLVVFVALGFTPWFAFGRVYDNARDAYIAAMDVLFPMHFDLTPGAGRHVHRVGEQVDVTLTFASRAPRQVTLLDVRGDAVSETRVDVVDGVARARIGSDAETTAALRFDLGSRATDTVELVFTNPPVLESMQTELVYPVYTRLVPRALDGVQQRFVALPGTRISLGFGFSKVLESATLTWDDGQTLPLEVVGRFASTQIMHNRAQSAMLQVVDEHGLAMEAALPLMFELLVDQPPRVALPNFLKNDMPMLPDAAGMFGFGARVEDDYGVARTVLKWEKASIDQPTRVTDRGEVERVMSPTRTRAVSTFEQVFEHVPLEPGDLVRFYVVVEDNRQPDAQRVTSPSRSFFIYQEGLEDLYAKELGLGVGLMGRGRVAKLKMATTVKEPEPLRTVEQVTNEFDASVDAAASAPVIRGDFQQAVKDYFELLSQMSHEANEASEEPEP